MADLRNLVLGILVLVLFSGCSYRIISRFLRQSDRRQTHEACLTVLHFV